MLRTKWHLDPPSRLPQQTWAENWGLCLLGGAVDMGPHLTQCRLGRGISVPSALIDQVVWPQQTWAENLGKTMLSFGEEELGPHLAQCGQGRGLPP